jgi:hypothetical protein
MNIFSIKLFYYFRVSYIAASLLENTVAAQGELHVRLTAERASSPVSEEQSVHGQR